MQILYSKQQLETYLEKIDFEQLKPLLLELYIENCMIGIAYRMCDGIANTM